MEKIKGWTEAVVTGLLVAVLAILGLTSKTYEAQAAGGASAFVIGASTPAGTVVLLGTSASTLYNVAPSSSATENMSVVCWSTNTTTGHEPSTNATNLVARISLSTVTTRTYPPAQPAGISAPLGLACERDGGTVGVVVYYQ